MSNRSTRVRAFAGSSLVVLTAIACVATPVFAQETSTDAEVGEVIISGSRVIRDGSQAPTPVTVVGAEMLADTNPRSLTEGVTQLPAFRASSNSQTAVTGSGGRNGVGGLLNLRNLEPKRNLVLLDGKRLVPTGPNGNVDSNIIPQSLVTRVDVVTGGASAAFGSDAVAGIVNFVLDKKFQGVKGNAQIGTSTYGDANTYRAGLTFGQGFADDRGRILFDIGHSFQSPVYDQRVRSWAQRSRGELVVPAALRPQYGNTANYIFDNVKQRNYEGGVILPPTACTGAAATTPQCLLGNTKILAGGVPAPYDPGTLIAGANQVGGDGTQNYVTLIGYGRNTNAFTRVSFDITDNLNVYVEALYGQNRSKYEQSTNVQATRDVYTIFEGNPFIPASIASLVAQPTTTGSAACTTAARTTGAPAVKCFQLTRNNLDWGRILADFQIKTQSFHAGFDGNLGDWRYYGYFTHGENVTLVNTRNSQNLQRNHAATDAILTTSGQVACAVTTPTAQRPASYRGPAYDPVIAAQYAGCAPMNPFGFGAPSKEAIAFVTSGGGPMYEHTTKQDVLAFGMAGSPFEGIGAGPFDVAFGLEYRKQSVDQISDAVSQSTRSGAGLRGFPATYEGLLGGYIVTNQQPFNGEYDIYEGYAEAQMPLLKEVPLAHSLSLNAAARYTEYSRSGGVATWKIGAVYEPVESLRFRGTVSRDIREANLNELFQGNSQGGPTIGDPFRAGATATIFSNTVGNPDLVPEEADTYAFGVVFQPTFLPGFTASIDYYDITIDGAVGTISSQRTLDECYGTNGSDGNPLACARISRVGGVAPTDGSQPVSRILTPFFNLDELKTSGLDIDIGYRTELWGGNLTIRAIAAYVGKFETTTPGSPTVDTAGVVGVDQNPEWAGAVNIAYDIGRWKLSLQERYIGSGLYKEDREEGVNINDNSIDAEYYMNIAVAYRWGEDENVETFLAINNVLNRDAPSIPQSPLTNIAQTNQYMYDSYGRYYTTGIRFRF